jgi:hypothetical protein
LTVGKLESLASLSAAGAALQQRNTQADPQQMTRDSRRKWLHYPEGPALAIKALALISA